MPEDQITFTLDGRSVEARKGELIIAAAERAGVFIPRFCYHPRMRPVGMCRMCLVEVSGPRGATLQPSCFVSVSDGMEVVTTSPKVKKAQDGVLEFLLVNHPLDCPVCDKGGECPLQDQTLHYGPGESRFVEEKRHFEKPLPISDLVLLDRERCIQCGRCTRFAAEVAGEAQIDFAGRGEHVEVAIFPETPFTSYFSGNTVQICPVGALTATPYRFTARPWDLDQVESTCTTCAFGCRVAVQSSGNRLTRLLGLDAEPVNHGWLCDKGRFVYEAVNGDVAGGDPPSASGDPQAVPVTLGRGFTGETHETGDVRQGRLTEPLVRKEGQLVSVSWNEALAAAADRLAGVRDEHGASALAFLGGARLTNEAAYAWCRVAKGVLGTDSVDAQLGDGLPAELVMGLPRATIDQACSARAVVLLTGDLREELPVLYLRLRESAVDGATRLIELSPQGTALTPYAAVSFRLRPGDAPGVAQALTGDDSVVQGLLAHPEGPSWSREDLDEARRLLAAASSEPTGAGVVVVLGRPSMAEHAGVVGEAAVRLARAWPGARFLPALRRGNVHGALDMGLAPGLLPGRVALESGRAWYGAAWGSVPDERGRDARQILSSLSGGDASSVSGGASDGAAESAAESAAKSKVRGLVLLGGDPLGDFPEGPLAERALAAADPLVVVGSRPGRLLEHADIVLPAAMAHERPGTTTNVEGRVSRLGQKLVPPGLSWPDWMIATELAAALGTDLDVSSLEELWNEIETVAPSHRGLTGALLERPSDGVLVPVDAAAGELSAPTLSPTDPIAIPGVLSVELQGAPPRAGLVEVRGGVEAGGPEALPSGGSSPVPAPIGADAAQDLEAPHVPPYDSYSLRLVSGRRLYDLGSLVDGSPSLGPLVGTAELRANPYDLDRFGLERGDRVRVRSPRGALELPAVPDPQLARGVVAVDFNLPVPAGPGAPGAADPGPDRNAAAVLIDGSAAVTEVRLESL